MLSAQRERIVNAFFSYVCEKIFKKNNSTTGIIVLFVLKYNNTNYMDIMWISDIVYGNLLKYKFSRVMKLAFGLNRSNLGGNLTT